MSGLNIDAILQRHAAAELEERQQLAAQQEQRIVQIGIDDLEDFPPELHKFKPATGQRLKDLEESIRINGIINPLIVRPLGDGRHQIIAGHNRRIGARNIGYTKVPCIVRNDLSDADALEILIVDNLLHRDLLPSERGWAYRQQMENTAIRAGRPSNNSSHSATNIRTDEFIGKQYGVGKDKVRRYIRLTYLIQPLLDLVDDGKLGITVGEQLSYLKRHNQETVYNFCYAADPQRRLKESQAKGLREVEADPERIIDEDLLEELTAPKKKIRFRTLKIEMSKLRQYFPVGTPEEVVVQTIHTALANYYEGKEE